MRGVASLSLILVVASGCQSDETVTGGASRDVATGALGDGPAGVYVLRTVAGQALPAVIASHDFYHAVMLADTVFLHEDGTGGTSEIKRVIEDPKDGEQTRTETVAFAYQMTGSRLTVELPCGPLASCSAPPHYAGTVSADALDLTIALNYRGPMHFSKVAGPTNVAEVRISPSSNVAIRAGQTVQFSATVLDAQGRTLDRKVAWTALSPSVGSMRAPSTLFGVTEGDAAIAAFVDGRTDTVFVRVNK